MHALATLDISRNIFTAGFAESQPLDQSPARQTDVGLNCYLFYTRIYLDWQRSGVRQPGCPGRTSPL